MQKLTKTDLIDKCIDGDNNKLVIFGDMFDLFSCMYTMLRNSNVQAMPDTVVFAAVGNDALFDVSDDIDVTPEVRKEAENIFGHRVEVQKSSEKNTNIRVCG